MKYLANFIILLLLSGCYLDDDGFPTPYPESGGSSYDNGSVSSGGRIENRSDVSDSTSSRHDGSGSLDERTDNQNNNYQDHYYSPYYSIDEDLGIIYLVVYGLKGKTLVLNPVGTAIFLPESFELEGNSLYPIPKNGFYAFKPTNSQYYEFSKYTLKSWNTEMDGSGEDYAPGSKIYIEKKSKLLWAIPNEPYSYNQSENLDSQEDENTGNNGGGNSSTTNPPVTSGIDKQNSTITIKGKTYKLYGKIKIVESGGDIKAKIVSSGQNLRVHPGNDYNSCGKFKLVSSGYDYKVQLVTSGEDIKVKITGTSNVGF
ncbi:MAG: hypothetical protein IKQ46_12995 [Bacteroidales bacterium]|jgi:hypothetical protein|nr:hypothetical protein [Bacteroidales bacterium]